MLGFIKYKLFKWLWNDICEKVNCENCPCDVKTGFGYFNSCNNRVVNCFDVEDLMYKTARRAWRIE